MIESDETLVRSAQGGDHAAFEELVRRTSRLVFAKLYLETGDTHQAEDLLQDTLLAAFRSLDQLTEPAKFRSWLLRIAQNQAIDAARRDSRQKRQEKPNVLVLQQESSPSEETEHDETRQKVLAVLRLAGGISAPLDAALPVRRELRDYSDANGIEQWLAAWLAPSRNEDVA